MSKPAPLPGDLAAEVERQRAEIDELRGWVRQYRHFAQQTPNVIFMLDLETGRIVYVNDRFEDLLGYTRAELMAPGFDFFVDDRPGLGGEGPPQLRDAPAGRGASALRVRHGRQGRAARRSHAQLLAHHLRRPPHGRRDHRGRHRAAPAGRGAAARRRPRRERARPRGVGDRGHRREHHRSGPGRIASPTRTRSTGASSGTTSGNSATGPTKASTTSAPGARSSRPSWTGRCTGTSPRSSTAGARCTSNWSPRRCATPPAGSSPGSSWCGTSPSWSSPPKRCARPRRTSSARTSSCGRSTR